MDTLLVEHRGEPLLDGTIRATSSALFSPDRRYRFKLTRSWDARPPLVVIGLNPSTADERVDDPTIRRCIGFAKREGLGGLVMLNLWSLRATDPRDLVVEPAAISDVNWRTIRAELHLGRTVLCAWGTNADRDPRHAQVVVNFGVAAGARMVCLGRTRGGYPRHPLYVPAVAPFVDIGADQEPR